MAYRPAVSLIAARLAPSTTTVTPWSERPPSVDVTLPVMRPPPCASAAEEARSRSRIDNEIPRGISDLRLSGSYGVATKRASRWRGATGASSWRLASGGEPERRGHETGPISVSTEHHVTR